LCGAAVPGALFLITGLHTGSVGFTVELHEDEPPVDQRWEEIVEAPFTPAGDRTELVGWAGEWSLPLELGRTHHRVRYCAAGMERGHETDTVMDGEPVVDRYLLQLWPAAPEPDRVLKVTTGTAAYWHDYARQQPPPPTAEEKAETARQAELERERRNAEARLAVETREWGGTLPSDRLRELGYPAKHLGELDRPLLDAFDRIEPETQRQVARWAARRAYEEAGLADVPWLAAALDALDAGAALPSVFNERSAAFDRLLTDSAVPHRTITTVDGRSDNFLQQAAAFGAVYEAGADDPLAAAINCARAAAETYGFGRWPELFAVLREAFPGLR
jgi:hypothetical protein